MDTTLERPACRMARRAPRKDDKVGPSRLAAVFDDAPAFDSIDTLDEHALRDIGLEPNVVERRSLAWRF